ncbi:MAG: PKD-like domain-containing protein [Chryseolinea sp.]
MRFFRLLKFLSVVFFLSTPCLVFAAPPVASGLFMTVPAGGGGMKIGHNIIINFIYNDPDGNAQQNTLIEWLQYDNDCPGIATVISTTTVSGATVTSNFNLPASTLGKHISCRITPRDNTGTLGTPVEFRPWSCGAPNPVLTNSATCVRAGGGVVGKGNSLPTSASQCSGLAVANWTVDFTGINYVVPGGLTPKIIIDWGDGITETLIPTLVDNTETNFGKQTWRVLRAHTFDYSIAGRTASTTVGARCTYTLRATYGVGATNCSASVQQTQPFTVWDTEDNVQLGTFDVDHDPTSAGVQTTPPAPLPASTENTNICENDVRAIRLFDNTIFNCTPPLEDPIPLVRPGLVNDKPRWVQWVYGTAGSNITTGPGATEKIIINGVSYTAAQLPVFGRPFYIPESTVGPSGFFTDDIVMPTSTSGNANEQLFVTLRSWNTCNAFDRLTGDGSGINPPQGAPFNVFNIYGGTNQPPIGIPGVGEPAGINPFFANSSPKLREYAITIVDTPDPPVVANKDICNGESTTLSVTSPLAGVTYRWYQTNADATSGNTSLALATGTTFTPSNAQIPTGNRKHFFVTAAFASGCVSTPTEVTITRRSALTQPPVITGPANLCPSSNYIYSVSSSPAAVTIIDPITGNFVLNTELFWTVPAGLGSISAGQATQSITITSAAAVGSGNVSVVHRYVTPPATTSGSQCSGTARTLPVNVRDKPTANITPDPATVCEGSTIQLNGNPSLPASAAGFTPSISSHSWGGSSGVLDNLSIQQPTVQGSISPATYGLTYVVTADFGGGVFCSSVLDNSQVIVSPNTLPSNAGSNQLLCTSVDGFAATLAGSNPGAGVGTWTFVSSIPVRPTPAFSDIHDPASTVSITLGNEGAYTLRWTVVSGTCTSFDEVVIDFGSTPTASIPGTAQGICGETATLAGNTPIIGSGTWTITGAPTGGSLTINSPTSPNSTIQLSGGIVYGLYQLTWTIKSGTCPASAAPVNITFSRPATATVPADFTTCVDQILLSPIPITGTVGGGLGASQQGRWERISGSGTFTSSGAGTGGAILGPTINDQYIPTAADFVTGFVDLRLVAIDPDGAGACGNVNSTTHHIAFDKKPANADAGSDVAVCNGDVVNLTAATPTNGGVGTWSPVTGVTDIHDPTTTVNGLSASATFTWTVQSAGNVASTPGACASTNNDMIVTVRTLPAALDPTPDLCETDEGTFKALNVLFTDFNDGVTNIPSSANRIVKWYKDANDQTLDNPIPTATIDISNGQILFTRVIDTSNPELCNQLGQVTFTVNSKPLALDKDFYFCEETIGSNTVNDIDLTDVFYKDEITGGAANRTVSWYGNSTDAEAGSNPISANDVDIAITTQVFARVVNDLTGCFNVAEVNLIIKPRPADQSILGSSTPCVGGTELYRVSQVAGATYTWNIPPQFGVLGGGGVNDFYVLLEFLAPTAPINIGLTVQLNGCAGNLLTKPIGVSAAPTGFDIILPASACENGIIPFTVLPDNTGSSSYNWQIFSKATGLPGGGLVVNGQTTGSVLINVLSEDIIIKVTESNVSNCVGTPEDTVVVVNKKPIMDPSIVPVCSGDITNILLSENGSSPVVATTFDVNVPSVLPNITTVSGPTQGVVSSTGIQNDIYRNLTTAPILPLLYRIKPISAVGCIGDEKSITLNIKAESLMDPNLDKAVCSDDPIEVTLKSAVNFIPADRFDITSIAFDAAKLTPLTPLPVTGAGTLYNANEIFNHAWENISTTDEQVIYTIRPYSLATGCFGNPPVPVKVTILRKPLVTPVVLPPVCSGEVLNIPLTSLNVPTATFSWTVSQINGNITGATSGLGSTISDQLINNDLLPGSIVYEIRASNPSSSPNCAGPPEYITVNVKPSPNVTPINDTICSDAAGGTTAVLDLTTLQPAVSADAGVTFTWFTNSNDFAGSQIPAAPHSFIDNVPVFVRVLNPNAASLCFKDVAVRYSINPTPLLTATPSVTNIAPFNISCFGKSDGQIVVSAQFGSGHTYSINGAGFVPAVSFNGLGASIPYTVIVKNSEGCTDTQNITLIEPPAIIENHSIVNASCFSMVNPDGQITISGSGGAGNLSYFLLQDPSNVSGKSTGAFVDVRPNNYTLRIEDENSCSATVSNILVGQPTEIKLTIAATTDPNGYGVTCEGASDGEIRVITISGGTPAALGYTYALDQDPLNTSGFTSGAFTNLSANTLYSITATDSKTCTKTSLPLVIIGPLPFYEGAIGLSKAVCEGTDPAVISILAPAFGGIGNYQYTWFESTDNVTFTPIANSNSATFDPPIIPVTTFYKRETSTGSCPPKESAVTTITVNPLPTASMAFDKPNPVCENDFILLTFTFTGAAPFFFDYNDGTTFVNNRIGANVTPIPIVDIKNDATYTLTRLKDFNGCVGTTTPISAPIVVSKINVDFAITSPSPQCSGSEFTFEWTVDPDVEYTWTWSDGTVDPPIPPNSLPLGLQPRAHIYSTANTSTNTSIPVSLSANIGGKCAKLTTKIISVYPNIFINAFPDKTIICSGETVKFTNNTTGGTNHHWYYREKFTPTTIGDFVATPVATNQSILFTNTTASNPITYEVVYDVNNSDCPDQATFDIDVYKEVTASFSDSAPTPYQSGKSTVVFTNTSTPLDATYFDYAWKFGANANPLTFDGTTSPLTVDFLTYGTRTVELVATNRDAITRGLTSGCASIASDEIMIVQPDLIAAFKYTPQTACFPDSIVITENLANGDLYQWKLFNITSGTALQVSNDILPVFKITNPGTYFIELKTTNSITNQTAFADNHATPIEIFDVPFAAFEARPKTIFIPDEQLIITNRSTDANQYDWDFDDGETSQLAEPNHFYALAGKYIVTLVAGFNHGPKDSDGDGVIDGDMICYDTARQEINAKEGGLTRIPNAFTPNTSGPNGGVSGGGTFNDVFIPITKGVEEFQMQIFDRWGSLIFESNEKNIGWDGYDKNGLLLPAGVYVYKLTLRLSNGQRTTQVGDVTLIR